MFKVVQRQVEASRDVASSGELEGVVSTAPSMEKLLACAFNSVETSETKKGLRQV